MRDVSDGFDFSTSDLIFSFSAGVKFNLSATAMTGGFVNLILSAKRPCTTPNHGLSPVFPFGSTAVITREKILPDFQVISLFATALTVFVV